MVAVPAAASRRGQFSGFSVFVWENSMIGSNNWQLLMSVYKIVDKTSGELIYIGQTQELSQRIEWPCRRALRAADFFGFFGFFAVFPF